MTLNEFFQEHSKAALAFSGGTDSAYLLYAARQSGADIRPYYVKTPFQPAFELEDARRFAEQLGVPLSVLEHDILSHENIAANPADRCYHCKTALLSLLKEAAARDGFALLLDGTNASDAAADRPGMRALREWGVRSPLRECGLRKDEIRRLSKEAGLFTWNKPAYACLATRIPTGEKLTAALLARVEAAEKSLSALGFSDFRARVFHNAARIQLPAAQFSAALERREQITAALKPAFDAVLLDLEAR